MPRAGRDLENIVASLERIIAGTGIEIKSPDYILGVKTNIQREIDISLRAQVGSVKILVIIECRDRKNVEDVTWIEQLSSKREDVLASKVIAVSSNGFSQTAKTLAQMNGVELRTIEELNKDLLIEWFKFKIFVDSAVLTGVEFGVSENDFDELNSVLGKFDIETPVLFDQATEEMKCISKEWLNLAKEKYEILENADKSSNITKLRIIADYETEKKYQLVIGKTRINIKKIFFYADKKTSIVQPSKYLRYADINGITISEDIVHEYSENGVNLKFDVINYKKDGNVT